MAWHCLEPADASVFDSATHLFRFPIKLPVPPTRVWESLASDRSLAAWPLGRGLYLDLHWTSPRPFGTGTTRQVTLPLRLCTLRESFFRWDEGKGYSFYAEAVNRPGLRRFAEDYVLQTTAAGTLLTWTVALEPAPRAARTLQLAAPLVRLAFGRTAAAATRYFAQPPPAS